MYAGSIYITTQLRSALLGLDLLRLVIVFLSIFHGLDGHAPEHPPIRFCANTARSAFAAYKADLLAVPMARQVKANAARKLEGEPWVELKVTVTEVHSKHILKRKSSAAVT